jgi:hypothetical protein
MMIVIMSVNSYNCVDHKEKQVNNENEDNSPLVFFSIMQYFYSSHVYCQNSDELLSSLIKSIYRIDQGHDNLWLYKLVGKKNCLTNRKFNTVLVVQTFNATMSFPVKSHDVCTKTSKPFRVELIVIIKEKSVILFLLNENMIANKRVTNYFSLVIT